MGRPTILDDRVREILVSAIRIGSSYKDACAFAGVSYRAFAEWMNKGRRDIENNKKSPYAQLVQDIEKARSDAYVNALSKIVEAYENGTWQAAAWFLERKYPEQFGKSRVEVSGVDGNAIVVSYEIAKKDLESELEKLIKLRQTVLDDSQ